MIKKDIIFRHEIFDTLRGIAIFLVFINHIPYNDYLLNEKTPYLVKKFFLFGTYGVQLFYITSAVTLLISLNLRKENSFLNFYLRRFIRVAPIFYVGIVINILYFYIQGNYNLDLLTLKNIFLNVFFINNVIPPSNDLILGGSTIATEMNFYLILPLIFLFINTYKKSLFLSFFCITVIFILNNYSEFLFVGKSFGDVNFYRTIFSQIYVFSLGVCFFQLHKNNLLDLSKKKINIIIKITPFIFLSAIVIALNKQEPEYFYFKNMYLVSTIFFILINISFNLFRYINRHFICKFFINLGKISFSMYLLHWITIDFSWKALQHLEYFQFFIFFFITFSFLFTFACSYYFSKLEYYFINTGKKFLSS